MSITTIAATTLIIACLTINTNADVAVPYRDSFKVLRSNAMNEVQTLQMIKHAEDARNAHGTDLTSIAVFLQGKFYELYKRGDCHCFVNIGEIRGGLVAIPHFIYLKSDTQDNLHILCFETTCGEKQKYIKT